MYKVHNYFPLFLQLHNRYLHRICNISYIIAFNINQSLVYIRIMSKLKLN